jgi:hypothetical protein
VAKARRETEAHLDGKRCEVQRHVIEREQDVLLDPCDEVAQRQENARVFAAIPHGTECAIERLRLWELGDFERMAWPARNASEMDGSRSVSRILCWT